MAATWTRSPSPDPSRPRTPDVAVAKSSHLRNHGCRSPSPAPRASAIDHKENERDFNSACSPVAAKAASSYASLDKAGAKNFMAPTISAAFKAVASSPRRKILTEKNEAAAMSSVRYTLSSLPDRNEIVIGPQLNENFGKEVGDSLEMCGEPRNVDLEAKNGRGSGVLSSPCSLSRSTSTVTAAIASLDADPTLPPYDPHTNYLSPRPRFLHYKPNPRKQQYWFDDSGLTEAGDNKCLEDSFSSESCNDSEGQIEEEQSSNLQNECEEESLVSQAEVMEGNITGIPVPESESKTKSSGKGRSFLCNIFASCGLVFLIACVLGLFGGYPTLSPSVLKIQANGEDIDHLHMKEYISAANLRELGRRFGHWSLDSFVSYVTVTTMPRQEIGPIFLANFTASYLEQRLDMSRIQQIGEGTEEQPFLKVDVPLEEAAESNEIQHSLLTMDVPLEDGDVNSEMEQAYNGDVEVHELYASLDEIEDRTSDVILEAETRPELHQYMQKGSLAELESGKKTVGDDANKLEVDGVDVNEYEHVVEVEQLSNGQDTNAFEIEDEAVRSQDDSVTERSSAEETPWASDEGIPINPELHELEAYAKNGKLAAGLFLAVLLLVASIMFILMKQKKTTIMMDEFEMPKAGEVPSKSVSGSSESYGQDRGSPFENTPVDTLLANSGPSEFSSSLWQSTSIGRQRTTGKNKEEETLSHEKRRLRRDSTVASSSISYGSFTTYEKLSGKKKGSRDEEVATPVRRSSRIKNQIA
ncbi:uncharacterized protein LOC122033469 [Zingiber officinale]|uniref:Uncharacterized protein n=1 Tax=Zingiber officinale TaxID=94328 RepID=A0A8J5EAQ2_ZINOF|nr:uncharacterized protein LOC122033469 [Zingiber officinale]KAG6469350.1 hypothetical protein ZIOFF_074065 [Zingiber officinale]